MSDVYSWPVVVHQNTIRKTHLGKEKDVRKCKRLLFYLRYLKEATALACLWEGALMCVRT